MIQFAALLYLLQHKQAELEEMAKKKKLSKEEREQLFAAVEEQYPLTTVIQRATLESWLPGININNATYILMRRNQMSANVMVSSMASNARKRQQKILDSFSKKQ